jgi:hypothetical protein
MYSITALNTMGSNEILDIIYHRNLHDSVVMLKDASTLT